MYGQAAQITDSFLWQTQEKGGTEHAAIPHGQVPSRDVSVTHVLFTLQLLMRLSPH